MRRGSAAANRDELRPEYDLSQLKGRVRGKYYELATGGGNMAWQVTEITLEAHYLNRPPDTLTLACRSVEERAAEYYPDKVAADGAVMRSVKERRSLLVRGINPQALETLTWQPTDVSFRDSRTGKVESFRVERRYSPEPGTLRLALLD
jgi:hypothetical protein